VSDWGGVNVLVTGGEGFIGSHLTEGLVAAGATSGCCPITRPSAVPVGSIRDSPK